MAEDDVPPNNIKKKCFWRKTATIAIIFLWLYVGSYFLLSRYSASELAKLNADGFYYVPCIPTESNYDSFEAADRIMSYFYSPIHAFDFHVLGGPSHACMPLMGLQP